MVVSAVVSVMSVDAIKWDVWIMMWIMIAATEDDLDEHSQILDG